MKEGQCLKIPREERARIRRRWLERPTIKSLAEEYNVSEKLISDIVSGRAVDGNPRRKAKKR